MSKPHIVRHRGLWYIYYRGQFVKRLYGNPGHKLGETFAGTKMYLELLRAGKIR